LLADGKVATPASTPPAAVNGLRDAANTADVLALLLAFPSGLGRQGEATCGAGTACRPEGRRGFDHGQGATTG
jgi:hypothetical protein